MNKLNEIIKHFSVDEEISHYGNGHINDTYLSDSGKYILQRINTNIFKNPEGVMENIELVTEFLREKIIKEGGNPERETLRVIKTRDGKNLYRDGEDVYRVYNFVDDNLTVEVVENPEDMYQAGLGFGKFARLLSDFPAEKLTETILDFHNTKKRFDAFCKVLKEDRVKRAQALRDEIDFVLKREGITEVVTSLIDSGEIPLRVTHNDTKINNILFDKTTREALCVIDLDTVMPGSMLYDFGDALRIGASTAAEDEVDLTKVKFSRENFEAFLKGYLKETAKILTPKEIELLAFSAKLLTFECGMRFLTDYLDGDRYFKIHHEGHNLDRARNQFKLVLEIEEMEDELSQIADRVYNEIKKEQYFKRLND